MSGVHLHRHLLVVRHVAALVLIGVHGVHVVHSLSRGHGHDHWHGHMHVLIHVHVHEHRLSKVVHRRLRVVPVLRHHCCLLVLLHHKLMVLLHYVLLMRCSLPLVVRVVLLKEERRLRL